MEESRVQLANRIERLHKDFLVLDAMSKEKAAEMQEFKKNFGKDFDMQESIKQFSNLGADFNLISRDSQIVFMELFSLAKFYRKIYDVKVSEEFEEFYEKYKVFYPETIFVVTGEEIKEREEGFLQKERDKFMQSDYIKSLINIKV